MQSHSASVQCFGFVVWVEFVAVVLSAKEVTSTVDAEATDFEVVLMREILDTVACEGRIGVVADIEVFTCDVDNTVVRVVFFVV